LCAAAHANVASVSYHFGDKHGLYREVLDEAVQIMQQTLTAAVTAGRDGDAEARLRAFIRVFLRRISSGRAPWIRQLMAHEMADPTDALTVVIEKVIIPRSEYIHSLVEEILGDDVERGVVTRCVMSVMAQFQAALTNPVTQYLVSDLVDTPGSVDQLAEHIAAFSIGGLRSLQRRRVRAKRSARGRPRTTERR
jgi:AcrR family transcriptional regulator